VSVDSGKRTSSSEGRLPQGHASKSLPALSTCTYGRLSAICDNRGKCSCRKFIPKRMGLI